MQKSVLLKGLKLKEDVVQWILSFYIHEVDVSLWLKSFSG